jgi:hypothetical protein
MNHSFPFRQPWLAGALAILLTGAAFLAVSLLMPSRPPAMVEVVIAATGTSVEQNEALTPTPFRLPREPLLPRNLSQSVKRLP